MAMKRKPTSNPYRRRFVKRRRYMKKRSIVRPVRQQGFVNVKRTFYGGTWTFGTATTNDFWRYFTYDMTSFNTFSEFAAVFDEYKVNAIKITFRPAYDTSIVDAVGVQAYAHYIVDPASTLLPSGTYTAGTLNTFLQNQGVKTRTLNRPFSIYYKPKVLDQVASTGTAAAVRSCPWIRTSETGPSFRGFHMFLQQNNFSTSNTQVKLDVFITFYAQFKNLR